MHWVIDLQHYLYLKRVTLEEMSHGGHFADTMNPWSTFCGQKSTCLVSVTGHTMIDKPSTLDANISMHQRPMAT